MKKNESIQIVVRIGVPGRYKATQKALEKQEAAVRALLEGAGLRVISLSGSVLTPLEKP